MSENNRINPHIGEFIALLESQKEGASPEFLRQLEKDIAFCKARSQTPRGTQAETGKRTPRQ